ncbi:MAG: uroporphyrinogen decarboxylase [Nonlabens sp.]|nr:uroporphyrinogen decarboxylase [Nonlabens sp.]
MGLTLLDFIGYLASFILLLSFTRKNVRHLRIINTLGCILFVIYGAMLSSWPVIITNVSIVLINLYYLFIQKPDVEQVK